MPSLVAARAANDAFTNLKTYLPVALFVGGTSGIGQATAEAFARVTKGNAHIIICGRNRAAAESIIAKFPKPTSTEAVHEFVECDVTLMKNVQATTDSLRSRLSKLNYLVLSTGILTVRGRDESAEGIDRKLALHYYARWKFVHDLVPLLQNAEKAGEDAGVMTIFSTGHGGKIDLDDLGLKKNFSLSAAGLQASTYNDLMVESFAERYPNITFTHIYPGIVRTPLLQLSHWALRPLGPLIKAAFYPISVKPEDCGEHMLYGLLHKTEGGSFRRNDKGDDIGRARYYGSEAARKMLWEHTVDEINRALSSS